MEGVGSIPIVIAMKDIGQAFMEAYEDQLWRDIFSWNHKWFMIWARMYSSQFNDLMFHIEESVRGRAGW